MSATTQQILSLLKARGAICAGNVSNGHGGHIFVSASRLQALARQGHGEIETNPDGGLMLRAAGAGDEIENARAAIMAQVDRQLERLPAALRRAVRESLIATLEAEISE